MERKIIHGDSQEKLKEFSDNSFDLCVCSPPYKDEDGYSPSLIENVFTEIYRTLKWNSLLFLNFGHLAHFKSRPFQVVLILEEIGFKLNKTITWVKNHYKPIQGKKRVNNLTEFVFLFYKGKMPDLDRLAVGIPYKDKSNATRWKNANGNDLKCGANVWYIPYETITKSEQKLHNDRFPVELPERCIKLCGYPVEKVIDPFGGSGTTGVACDNLGKSFTIIEKNKENFEICQKRLFNPGIHYTCTYENKR